MSAPRRAATVLVLREGPGGIEVLLVRRGRGAPFMADAYVFPGGRIDDADGEGEEGAVRCARRELREEVGLLLSEDAGSLVRFSHWITPSLEPRRFDTDFFLARLPPGQTPALDEKELADLIWLTPDEALRRSAEGSLKLPPPTRCNLEELVAIMAAGADDLDGLFRRCEGRQPSAILPKLAPEAGGGLAVVMPWDPEFPSLDGEGEAVPCPPGVRTRRCVLTTEGRWRFE